MELLVARNPDPSSSLPYLVRLPLAGGLTFRTKGTWPRTNALYCHPVPADEWPTTPDIVERVPLRSCSRRGAAIDVVAERGREQRSQLVFTQARGREVVFWQAPRTRKQSRPGVRMPTARAAGLDELEIVVDAHERYPWSFPGRSVRTVRRGLVCGDYAVTRGGGVVAAVERKSVGDLASSLTSGRLKFALGELASLPRAAVVVEESYSRVFALEHVRPAVVADGLAELQVLYPSVPVVFTDTRPLAQEWAYRFLAAARAWADVEDAAGALIEGPGAGAGGDAAGVGGTVVVPGAAPVPSSREVRAWARSVGLPVADRGRLRPETLRAWYEAHGDPSGSGPGGSVSGS